MLTDCLSPGTDPTPIDLALLTLVSEYCFSVVDLVDHVLR
jgi:hypothetical protein